MSTALDAIVSRLQVMQPFNIYKVLDNGTVEPWFEVTGGIVGDLIIKEAGLAEQVQAISAQVMNWGRMAAQAKRIWEIEERRYRVWRDKTALGLVSGGKKMTQAQVDETIRSQPEYQVWYQRIERAEEAYNAAMGVLDGFRAKKDMMKAAVIKDNESSAPRLSI